MQLTKPRMAKLINGVVIIIWIVGILFMHQVPKGTTASYESLYNAYIEKNQDAGNWVIDDLYVPIIPDGSKYSDVTDFSLMKYGIETTEFDTVVTTANKLWSSNIIDCTENTIEDSGVEFRCAKYTLATGEVDTAKLGSDINVVYEEDDNSKSDKTFTVVNIFEQKSYIAHNTEFVFSVTMQVVLLLALVAFETWFWVMFNKKYRL